MVELRCPNCKRVWQYEGHAKFYTHCPQCSKQHGLRVQGIMAEITLESEVLIDISENKNDSIKKMTMF